VSYGVASWILNGFLALLFVAGVACFVIVLWVNGGWIALAYGGGVVGVLSLVSWAGSVVARGNRGY